MNGPVKVQADNAYSKARRKAFFGQAIAVLRRRTNRLIAFDEISQMAQSSGPVDRGLTTVPVDSIIGSVDRYKDFDRAFLPSQTYTRDRWRRVGEAYFGDVHLPPVTLYKLGEVYFVIDGNHRVSVARELGQEFVDAYVQEFRPRVQLTRDVQPEDLRVITNMAEFLEVTGIGEKYPATNFRLTIADNYTRLYEHIVVHQYFKSRELNRELSDEEAVEQWYTRMYMPTIELIRETNILADFPGRTETDLFLWLADHMYYLREQYGDVNPYVASQHFANHFSPRWFKRFGHWLKYHALPQRKPPEGPY